MKKSVLFSTIVLLSAGCLGLTGCGDTQEEISVLTDAQIEALLQDTDFSVLDTEEYTLPTKEEFIGVWVSGDDNTLIKLTISTDLSSENADRPYKVSIERNSDAGMDMWNMNAALDPDDPTLLTYTDAKKNSFNRDNMNDETMPGPEYEDGTGYFRLEEEELVWNDDKEGAGADYRFTKENDVMEQMDATEGGEASGNTEAADSAAAGDTAPADVNSSNISKSDIYGPDEEVEEVEEEEDVDAEFEEEEEEEEVEEEEEEEEEE